MFEGKINLSCIIQKVFQKYFQLKIFQYIWELLIEILSLNLKSFVSK